MTIYKPDMPYIQMLFLGVERPDSFSELLRNNRRAGSILIKDFWEIQMWLEIMSLLKIKLNLRSHFYFIYIPTQKWTLD